MKWVSRISSALGWNHIPAPLRKLIVAVIPVGLGILATEFAWARRAVHRARGMIAKARGREPEPAAK